MGAILTIRRARWLSMKDMLAKSNTHGKNSEYTTLIKFGRCLFRTQIHETARSVLKGEKKKSRPQPECRKKETGARARWKNFDR